RKDVADLRDFDLAGVFFHRNRHNVGMCTTIDLPTAATLAAEIVGRLRVRTVQDLRDHECSRVLTHACGSREDQTMREASFTQLRTKPIDDLVISDERIEIHVGKCLSQRERVLLIKLQY